MNVSSENQTSSDIWTVCLEEGYVGPVLYNAIQALCFLLGTPALVWCLWISLRESISGGLKPTQVFPINLFAVELVFCVLSAMDMTSYVFMRQDTILRKVVYVLYYLSWGSRTLFQCCICVERYLAVAQPVAFLKYSLKRYRVGTSTVIWVLSLLYGYLYKFNVTISDNFLIGVYCLGVVVTSLCCFFILRVLKQPGPGEVEGGRGGEKKQGTTDPQKMRAFRIILTNLVIIVSSTRMNDSSENQTSSDIWTVCLEKGYVAPVLYHAVQALCFLLATPALVWCLWISLRESISGGLKPTQVFPINLFAAELVFSVEGPIEITSYLLMRDSAILLKVMYAFYYLSWGSRPLFQCCICVERYLAVAQPVAFLKYRLMTYRMGTSTVIWLLSLLYGYLTTLLNFTQNFSIYVLIGVNCIGVVIISFCCFFILRVLKQPGPGEVEGGREETGDNRPTEDESF
ncbi:hypothetical protein DPEC_G00184430 [Dallia pectoralis]|uniref:Uncharacterized protein n=1 Tax=Dallia pectoralis TaxID=75939 RepID=A0ACC2GB09_DALPE|nr:hypothetical protein DPEC_G00184430 [Dallia pectoralis]